MCKRLCFEYEREFRGIIFGSGEDPAGVSVPVNLQSLIQEVYINPLSPRWIESLVNALIKRYGVQAKVQKSALLTGPQYEIDLN